MARRLDHRRAGFTLVELMVVMSIVVLLAGIVIVFSWSALDRNRAAGAVNKLQGSMQIARSRAHRDGLPHGIRLIVGPGNLVTTYQYIYSPPVVRPATTNFAPGPSNVNAPYVELIYRIDGAGQVVQRTCAIFNLSFAQQQQVTVNSILYLPELGTYHRISGAPPASPIVPPPPMSLILDDAPTFQYGYPDAQMGAATHLRTYYFGIYGAPEPLVGDEVMQLPEGSCVDLNVNHSIPSLPNPPGTDRYDILFAPSGQLVSVPPPSPNTAANGHVFLWIRDPSRPDNLTQGGEQLLSVIRAQSGALGGAPVDHGADPYSLGKKAVTGH